MIFCTYENMSYEIYKDLMSTMYFPVVKLHLIGNCLKENSNSDCAVNVKIVEMSNEQDQDL